MAVTFCELMREGRGGSFGEKSAAEYTAQWRVITNNKDDGPERVKTLGPFVGPTPIPVIGSIYAIGNDADAGAFCDKIDPQQGARVNEWLVNVHYRQLEPGEQYDDLVSTNPLTRPVQYRLDHEHWTRVVEKDKDGVALKNSAGVPFDTGVETDDSFLVLVAEKNFATLQEIINLNLSFAWKVNTGIFKGGAARSWLCRPIICSDIQTENNISFFRATFHTVYNPELWDVPILDKGFSELNGGVLRDILDKNKQPITEPWPLNGAGVKLPEGNALVFLTKRIRGETSFTGLGI